MQKLMLAYFAVVCVCTSPMISAPAKAVSTPSFELLTGAYRDTSKQWHTFTKSDKQDLRIFAENYNEKIGLLHLSPKSQNKIPHTLHFIWVGPRDFPADSVANVQSWIDKHPGWTYKFWTDREERRCPVEGMEKRLIDNINFTRLKRFLSQTKNYAEQADLMRYEIMYDEGGVYVDHDVLCLHSFHKFNRAYDFFAALESPHVNVKNGTDTKIFPGNCLFGAKAKHPILKETIRQVKKRWKRMGKKFPELDPSTTFKRVMCRTFHSFTLATKSQLNKDLNVDIVLPACYFFAHVPFKKKSTLKQLHRKGLIWASHTFESLWREQKGKKKVQEKKSSSKKSTKK